MKILCNILKIFLFYAFKLVMNINLLEFDKVNISDKNSTKK